MKKAIMMTLLAVGAITSSVWAYNPYAPNPFDVVEKKSQAYICKRTDRGRIDRSRTR